MPPLPPMLSLIILLTWGSVFTSITLPVLGSSCLISQDVSQMVTFLEGFLDFSSGRGKFFLFLFASLPSVFNLLL